MHSHHDFQEGSIVLAKVAAFPFWPAKVLTCLKNGTYKVIFIGENSEAILLPSMVAEFSQANVQKLRKYASKEGNRHLREALKIAEKTIEERKKGNTESAEEVHLLLRGMHASRKKRENPTSQEHLGESYKEEQSERDKYDEIKLLLNRLSLYSANFISSTKPAKFTQEDNAKLAKLMEEAELKDLIEKLVIEKLMLTITDLEQWGAPNYEALTQLLKDKYKAIKSTILSPSFASFPIDAHRRETILQRVKHGKVYIPHPQPQ